MTTMLRWLSAILFLSALGSLATLLVSDILNQLQPTALHRVISSLALILIGASFICLQLSFGRPLKMILKEVLLGLAFVLWGGEQFLQPNWWVTFMDSAVVLIFVIDLSLIIIPRLKHIETKSITP